MAYVHSVELATPNKRFKHNAKPSLLQSKLKSKKNRWGWAAEHSAQGCLAS